MIRDIVDEYFDEGVCPNLTKETDPFWDPPEAILVGWAYYHLKHLANLFDNEFKTKIIDATSM